MTEWRLPSGKYSFQPSASELKFSRPGWLFSGVVRFHESLHFKSNAFLPKGAFIYDVRSGWGEGVLKKQTKGTKSADL